MLWILFFINTFSKMLGYKLRDVGMLVFSVQRKIKSEDQRSAGGEGALGYTGQGFISDGRSGSAEKCFFSVK